MQIFSSSPHGVAPRRAGRTNELRAPLEGADLRPSMGLDDDLVPRERAEFESLRAAYGASGGLAAGDELARLLEDGRQGGYAGLARLIVSAEVFGFGWRQAFWVPMFQFDLADLTVRPGSKEVLAELVPTYDGWALARWFVEPSAWLDGRRPLDLLPTDRPSVLEAARADRFVATC